MVVSRSRVSRWKLSLLILLRIFILLLSSFIFSFLPSFLLFFGSSISLDRDDKTIPVFCLSSSSSCAPLFIHPRSSVGLINHSLLFMHRFGNNRSTLDTVFQFFLVSLPLSLSLFLSSPFRFFLVLLHCESQHVPPSHEHNDNGKVKGKE